MAVSAVGVELRALGPVEAVVGGRLADLGPRKQRGRVAPARYRAGAPSEPCLRVGPAHGSSKPQGLAGGAESPCRCLLGVMSWQAAGV